MKILKPDQISAIRRKKQIPKKDLSLFGGSKIEVGNLVTAFKENERLFGYYWEKNGRHFMRVTHIGKNNEKHFKKTDTIEEIEIPDPNNFNPSHTAAIDKGITGIANTRLALYKRQLIHVLKKSTK